MSEDRQLVVVLADTDYDTAVGIFGESLEDLVAEYEFGFRTCGSADRLAFDRESYRNGAPVDETIAPTDLTKNKVDELVRKYRWIAMSGTLAVPDAEPLVDFGLLLYPTFSPKRPARVFYWFDYWLLQDIYGPDEDAYDPEAAERLLRLSIFLGANRKTDGFRLDVITAYDEIVPANPERLRSALLQPAKTLDGDRPGLVTGIKSSQISVAELRMKWPGMVVQQTVSGFSVLSRLAR
jgi:hypothetical protein